MARDALSSRGGRQGARRRLRDAAGPRLLRSTTSSSASIRVPTPEIGSFIEDEERYLGFLLRPFAMRFAIPDLATSFVFRDRALFRTRWNRKSASTPLTIIHAFAHTRCVVEDVVERSAELAGRIKNGEIRELLEVEVGFLRRNRQRQAGFHLARRSRRRPRLCRSRSSGGRTRSSPNFIWFANFQGGPGRKRQGRRRQGRRIRRRRRRAELYVHRRPHHGAVRGPDHGDWIHLERPRRLCSDRTRHRHLQRHDTANGLAISRGQSIHYNALAYQGTAIAWASRLQSRQLGRNRQSQLRNSWHVCRVRDQRDSTPIQRSLSKTS